MATRYTSIDTVIDRVLRHPLMKGMSTDTIIDHIVDFMHIVGTPTMFDEKTAEIKIKDYRASLPDDFVEVIQIRDKKGNVYNTTSNTFHMSKNEAQRCLEYKIQGGFIITSTSDGTLEIAYKAIQEGSDGRPMIPDNASFLRAVEAYIKKNHFTVLVDTGKMHPTILQNVQQEYAWAVGDCQTEFNRLTIDEMNNLGKLWKGLLPSTNKHKTHFR